MSLGFEFKSPVDPRKPLDPSDPPPRGWDTDIDTRDHRVALFSVPSPLFSACREWEKREIERYKKAKRKVKQESMRTPIEIW